MLTALCSVFSTWVPFYQCTRALISTESSLHRRHCDNLFSYIRQADYLPTDSAAKFIVPHDPSFGALTSTKQRDKECGAHEIFWCIDSLYKYAACEADLQIQNSIFTDILYKEPTRCNFGSIIGYFFGTNFNAHFNMNMYVILSSTCFGP